MTEVAHFRWRSGARTHVGKVRELNEDAFLELAQRGVWAVADGMGGHAVGDVASRMVVDSLGELSEPSSLEGLIDEVSHRLQMVNQQLVEEAVTRQEAIIGSTVAVLANFQDRCAYLWAGDSRIYLSRGGRLQQLTRDHTQVEHLIAEGLLDRSEVDGHPAANAITRAVGAAASLTLEVEVLDIRDGDVFLLCSDGLTTEVSDNEIATELVRGDCQRICDNLVDRALSGQAQDNITVVVVRADDILQADKTIINPIILDTHT